MTVVLIAVFGIIGVLLRYSVDRLLVDTMGPFPVATFVINVSGSFLIGYIYALGVQRGLISEQWRLALTIGLLGGFTTFSAFSLQVVELAESKQLLMASAYMILSPALGVLAAWAGLSLGRPA